MAIVGECPTVVVYNNFIIGANFKTRENSRRARMGDGLDLESRSLDGGIPPEYSWKMFYDFNNGTERWSFAREFFGAGSLKYFGKLVFVLPNFRVTDKSPEIYISSFEIRRSVASYELSVTITKPKEYRSVSVYSRVVSGRGRPFRCICMSVRKLLDCFYSPARETPWKYRKKIH